MRSLAFGLVALVVACAGTPPPPAQKPEKVAVVEAKPEPAKPPPPEPLATQSVELTQKSEFISLGLGSVEPKLWSDDELEKRLPAAAKAELVAVERARQAVRDAEAKEGRAAGAFYTCDGCRERAQLEIQHKAAMRAALGARQALDKAIEHAEKALDKQLGAPKAVAELGIALARIQSRGSELAVSDNLAYSAEYAEPRASIPGTDALERAVGLAGPDSEAGQRVRQELLLRLWSKTDAERARVVIGELRGTAPREWRAELGFRAALLDALDGNDEKAAQGFEAALTEHVPGSPVTRKTLATAVLLARYRGLDFERALAAAMRVFEESARPEPPPPEPPPPVTKPKPAAKAPKRLSPAAARKAALRDAAQFGMLGMLSSFSSGSSGVGQDGVLRLAADSVERLDRDPTTLDGPAAARAGILSLIAVRALYRNDVAKARRLAEAARGVGALAEARDAVDVLRALALRDGDSTRAAELKKEKDNLPWGGSSWFGSRGEPDERELGEYLRAAESEHPTKKSEGEAEPEPAAVHNVRSALRACIEPVRKQLPEATGKGKERHIAKLSLSAKVFEDGHAELEVDADRKEGGMAKVVECLESVGPRMLAHAPSSVSATVVLDDTARTGNDSQFGLLGAFGSGRGIGSVWGNDESGSALGGFVGSEIGESFGAGGLGLRGTGSGGGGTGEGIGLGSFGGLGHGSGAGYGTGKGRIGAKKPLKKPPPKKPPVPIK